MTKDSAGISDEADVVVLGADDVQDLAGVLGRDPNAKGPVDVYAQTLADGTERLVDRSGNVLESYDADAAVEYESYPGAKGGPVLPDDYPDPDPEGEPE